MKKNILNLYEGFFDDLDKLNPNQNKEDKEDKVNDEFSDVNSGIYDEHDFILSPYKNPEFFICLRNMCKEHYPNLPSNENGFTQEDLNQITYIKEANKYSDTFFENITSLDELKYFHNLKIIHSYSFYKCNDLKSVIFPKNLKKIEYGTFGYCTSLQKIIFPKNISNIEYFSFACCENVKKIVIPKRFKNNIHDIFYNVNLKKVKKITYI